MEEIIGNKTAPVYNGSGTGSYVDPVIQQKAKAIASQIAAQKNAIPAAKSGEVSQAVVAGRDRTPTTTAKPTTADANTATAYAKAKAMQKRLAEQNGGTEVQKAKPVIKALLDMIYGGN